MTIESEGELSSSRGVDTDDLRRREKEATDYLLKKQYDFACRCGDIDPELLRGLQNCNSCQGKAYQWGFTVVFSCDACANTGWEGGHRDMSEEDWIALSQAYLEWSL